MTKWKYRLGIKYCLQQTFHEKYIKLHSTRKEDGVIVHLENMFILQP